MKISIDNKRKSRKNYYWSFEEIKNNKTYDLINDKEIALTNCQLLSELNYKWRKLGAIKTNGSSGYCFDDKNGKVIVVDESKVSIYNLQNNRTKEIAAKTSAYDFKIYYDTLTQNLYSYHRGGGEVSTFDWATDNWSKIDTSQDSEHFYHNMTFINPLDSSMYMFGGYGRNTFHNEFQRYNFITKKWKIVNVAGENIGQRKSHSRYLAITDSTLMTYGGYGNITGGQADGVRYYHDLWEINLKRWELKKIESLKQNSEEPANRLFYYDKRSNEYYFIRKKYYFVDPISMEGDDKYLVFLKCSGDNFSYLTLINSTKIDKKLNILDAFYNRKTNEIIAILMSFEGDERTYEIHSIFFPMVNNEINVADNNVLLLLNEYWYLVVVLLVIFSASIVLVILREKEKRGSKEIDSKIKLRVNLNEEKYFLYLFGDLQFLDKNFEDKTHLMSAKLTEMFLLILFHTFKLTSNNGTTGITTEKLSTILWPNMSNSSLKNTRNVTINKLRGVLSEFGGIKIVFKVLPLMLWVKF